MWHRTAYQGTDCTHPSYRTTVPAKVTVYRRCGTELHIRAQIVHIILTEQLYLLRLPCTGGVAQNCISGHRLYTPFLQNPHILHGTPGSTATRSPTSQIKGILTNFKLLSFKKECYMLYMCFQY